MKNSDVELEKVASLESASMPLVLQISDEGIIKVEKVANLKHEVWKLTKLRVRQLEEKNKGLQNHLIGLKFNMDD
jgi:hypothetical protein